MSETALETSVAVIANEVKNISEGVADFKQETRAAHVRIESKIDSLDVVTVTEFKHALEDIDNNNKAIMGRMDGFQGQLNAVNAKVDGNETDSTTKWLNLSKWILVFIAVEGAAFFIARFASPK